MKKLLILLLIPVCSLAQRTTKFSFPIFTPYTTASVGSQTDTSISNAGVNSLALRSERFWDRYFYYGTGETGNLDSLRRVRAIRFADGTVVGSETKGDFAIQAYITLDSVATPSTPAYGKGRIIGKGVNDVWYLDGAGTIKKFLTTADTASMIGTKYDLSLKADKATTITVAGTANQITSSAGAQDLSANRTWTLSLPNTISIGAIGEDGSLSLFDNNNLVYHTIRAGGDDVLHFDVSTVPDLLTLSNAGNAVLAGNLAVNGGSLTSTATTFNLLNSTPTTVNAFGASTTNTLFATGNRFIADQLSSRPRFTWGSTAGTGVSGRMYLPDSLYSLTTLWMDASRNLSNIGTISSDAITSSYTAGTSTFTQTSTSDANTGVRIVRSYGSGTGGDVLELRSHGDNGAFAAAVIGSRSGGTSSSPSQVLGDWVLTGLYGKGWDNTPVLSANVGAFRILAAENFTSSARGTYMDWAVTAVGATSRTSRMFLANDGSLTVGTSKVTNGAGVITSAGSIVSGDKIYLAASISDVNANGTWSFARSGADMIVRERVGGVLNTRATFVSGGDLSIVGKISTYNNVATAGYGVPAIVDDIDLTSQTAAIGSTNFANAGTAGKYRVNLYLATDVSDALGGTVTTTIAWNDGISAKTYTSATLATTGNNYVQDVIYVYLGSGSVSYSTTFTRVATEKYELRMTCEKVK